MKISRYIAMLVLLCAFLLLPALAADGYEAALGVKISEATTGDEITAEIALSGTADGSFAAIEMDIAYDSTRLRLESVEPAPQSVVDKNGVLRLVDCGTDKLLATGTYTLHFTALRKGTAKIELRSVRLGTKESAATEDLWAAALTNTVSSIVIAPKAVHHVSLPANLFVSGSYTVDDGDDYTLTVADYGLYDYRVTATMAGKAVAVTDCGDGRFTVKDVVGELVFSVERTIKPTPSPEPTAQPESSPPVITRTGDEAMPLLWLTLCVLCAAALVTAADRKKRTKSDRS